MPDWPSHLDDIKWDFAASSHARDQFRQAANQLERITDDIRHDALIYLGAWWGADSMLFGANLMLRIAEAYAIAEQFRDVAEHIRRLDSTMEIEQRSREAERERWLRERERQRAAAQPLRGPH